MCANAVSSSLHIACSMWWVVINQPQAKLGGERIWLWGYTTDQGGKERALSLFFSQRPQPVRWWHSAHSSSRDSTSPPRACLGVWRRYDSDAERWTSWGGWSNIHRMRALGAWGIQLWPLSWRRFMIMAAVRVLKDRWSSQQGYTVDLMKTHISRLASAHRQRDRWHWRRRATFVAVCPRRTGRHIRQWMADVGAGLAAAASTQNDSRSLSRALADCPRYRWRWLIPCSPVCAPVSYTGLWRRYLRRRRPNRS